MSDEGYGWAPKSFVFRSDRNLTYKYPEELEETLGSVSEYGLAVQYAGFVFPEDMAPWRESETMIFRDGSNGSWFKVTPYRVRYSPIALSRHRTACLIFKQWPLEQEVSTKLLSVQRSQGMSELHHVLADTGIPAIDKMLQNMHIPHRTIQYKPTWAVLGSVYGEVGGRIMTLVHSVALIERCNLSMDGVGTFVAEVLPPDQCWCVG